MSLSCEVLIPCFSYASTAILVLSFFIYTILLLILLRISHESTLFAAITTFMSTKYGEMGLIEVGTAYRDAFFALVVIHLESLPFSLEKRILLLIGSSLTFIGYLKAICSCLLPEYYQL